MALTKPPLATVTAGDPVTEQGWNSLVGGLSSLFDAVISLGGGTLRVAVTTGSTPIDDATVIAEPLGEGRPSLATRRSFGAAAGDGNRFHSGPRRTRVARA